MKVETPQILWHNGCDNEQNKNAPIYSITMIESGFCTDNMTNHDQVLATAGNNEINLWRIQFKHNHDKNGILQQKGPTKPEHLVTLSRHDATVNVIQFSPNGLHLATAGDSGSIIVWSVPPAKRGNRNGRHFWSTLNKEGDLSVRIVNSSSDGIYDLDWSADSKRFMVGSLDHNLSIFEDEHYATNQKEHNTLDLESQWRAVYRNSRDHTHYIQGVAFDPKGVYVASSSCDRTVRVYQRKPPVRGKKTLLRPENKDLLQQALINGKLDFVRGKLLKYRELPQDGQPKPKKQNLFADEATGSTHFRRLRFTTDGAYLICPTGVWHPNKGEAEPSWATYVFARHRFDKPYKVLAGLDKVSNGILLLFETRFLLTLYVQPSRVICPNPLLFELPLSSESKKHNGLPYRSIFAVLTEKSILIYDTYHGKPLCLARGLHYAGLTDAVWTSDGRTLLVSSSDGYISVISFKEGELGTVYSGNEGVTSVKNCVDEGIEPPLDERMTPSIFTPSTMVPEDKHEIAKELLFPALPSNKKRVAIQSTTPISPSSRNQLESMEQQHFATKVNVLQPKKKKRVTPTLVTTTSKH
jgi:chromatin assembly factor 1 subunit B